MDGQVEHRVPLWTTAWAAEEAVFNSKHKQRKKISYSFTVYKRINDRTVLIVYSQYNFARDCDG